MSQHHEQALDFALVAPVLNKHVRQPDEEDSGEYRLIEGHERVHCLLEEVGELVHLEASQHGLAL